jgi:arylsulfatase A-like enzyme
LPSRFTFAQAPPAKPNILFIAVDDLNHWVRHLGRNPQVITPNIDRLAQRGVTFTRAYCAAPVCNPSRAALMSGLRPATTGCYDNNTDWRPLIDPSLPLTTHFRKGGYFVAGAGKIYHGSYDRRSEFDAYMTGRGGAEPKPKGSDGVGGIKFGPLDSKDEDLVDYRITDWCIEELGKKQDKPFFLACGLHKPHMPWNVPQKYFDMYPLDRIELPKVNEKDLDDVPAAGVRMARPQGDHAQILASGRWKEAVQAYLATITYCDMNVGRLLDALDKSPYKDNTIICFWGDHGWHLGEKQHWRKFALWEEATRAPFIWIVPGLTKPDSRCDRTVDFMSIYPTLCELSGLPIPTHVQGASIKSLLADPQAQWKTPALTTYLFNNHSVRSEQWRYIRYNDGGEELYDETKDPLEWTNLASSADLAAVKGELAKLIPMENKPAPAAAQRQRQRPRQPPQNQPN